MMRNAQARQISRVDHPDPVTRLTTLFAPGNIGPGNQTGRSDYSAQRNRWVTSERANWRESPVSRLNGCVAPW